MKNCNIFYHSALHTDNETLKL